MVIGMKLTALLADAAFAEDDDLLSPPERIHDDSPLLEGDVGAYLHGRLLLNASAPMCPLGNPRAVSWQPLHSSFRLAGRPALPIRCGRITHRIHNEIPHFKRH